MSCSGCRVLRKGCSDDCMLRHCLHWIQSPQAQAHATVFVAKFFGRAALMSFVSAVPPTQRPPLFQSLLYEAVGRSINPVNGAVGLLWTGNWHLCQLGVETVLGGGALSPLPPELIAGGDEVSFPADESFGSSQRDMGEGSSRTLKRKEASDEMDNFQARDQIQSLPKRAKKHRAATPSEESETTTFGSTERKLLTLFF